MKHRKNHFCQTTKKHAIKKACLANACIVFTVFLNPAGRKCGFPCIKWALSHPHCYYAPNLLLEPFTAQKAPYVIWEQWGFQGNAIILPELLNWVLQLNHKIPNFKRITPSLDSTSHFIRFVFLSNYAFSCACCSL